jgi:hypothetical protein
MGPNYIDKMRREDVDAFDHCKIAEVLKTAKDWINQRIDSWDGREGKRYRVGDNDSVVVAWLVWLGHHKKYHPELPRQFARMEELWMCGESREK